MTDETVFQNDDAILIYHANEKILHHEFLRPVSSDTFRKVLNLGVEIFTQNHATKWLSDDRKNGIISDEDSAWSLDDWSPRVFTAGWKYWALVVPDDPAARIDMVKFVAPLVLKGLIVRIFTKPEEAMNWLRNIQ